MANPKPIDQVDFPGETMENLDETNLDYERAREAVEQRAKTYDSEPMLLAWYDRSRNKASPDQSCEEEGGDPGWVNYAKGHGGNLTVNVNHGEYIFIFKSKHPFPS